MQQFNNEGILYEVDGFKITNLVIGKGMTGTCYQCFHDKIKERICAKVIVLKPGQVEQVMREAEVLQKLQRIQNDYITKIFYITQKHDHQYIFMEECVQGDLRKLMNERKASNTFFSVEEVLIILKQLVRGYKILYFQQIIHRDLKPSNILIGNNGFLQITDYGASKIQNDMESVIKQSSVGTPSYQAPQFFYSSEYSSKCDIYSLGVIIFELLYGNPLIEGKGWEKLYEQLKNLKETPIKVPQIPQQQLGFKEQNEFITWFLQNSLQYEEEHRLSWNDLFKKLEELSIFQTEQKQTTQQQEQLTNIKPTTYYKLQLQNSNFIIQRIVQLILIKNSFVEQLRIKQENFFKNNLMFDDQLTSDFHEYSKVILEGYQYSLFLNLHHFLFQKGRKELPNLQVVQELQNNFEYQVAQFISQTDYEIENQLSYIKQFYLAQKSQLQKQLNDLIKKNIHFDLGFFFGKGAYLNYLIFVDKFQETIDKLMEIYLNFENQEFIHYINFLFRYIGFSIRFLQLDIQYPMASFLISSSSDILYFPDDIEKLQKYIEGVMKKL